MARSYQNIITLEAGKRGGKPWIRGLRIIQDLYPNSTQVTFIGMEQLDDIAIRQYAIENDFVIVTKDADFYEMDLLLLKLFVTIYLR